MSSPYNFYRSSYMRDSPMIFYLNGTDFIIPWTILGFVQVRTCCAIFRDSYILYFNYLTFEVGVWVLRMTRRLSIVNMCQVIVFQNLLIDEIVIYRTKIDHIKL
jgi:hypothetical protein